MGVVLEDRQPRFSHYTVIKMSANPGSPGPAYDLNQATPSSTGKSMDYSSFADSDAYYHHDGANSSVTGHGGTYFNREDATEIVHEMHLALLFLLSNPDEFKKAMTTHPPRGVTTLSDWNA